MLIIGKSGAHPCASTHRPFDENRPAWTRHRHNDNIAIRCAHEMVKRNNKNCTDSNKQYYRSDNYNAEETTPKALHSLDNVDDNTSESKKIYNDLSLPEKQDKEKSFTLKSSCDEELQNKLNTVLSNIALLEDKRHRMRRIERIDVTPSTETAIATFMPREIAAAYKFLIKEVAGKITIPVSVCIVIKMSTTGARCVLLMQFILEFKVKKSGARKHLSVLVQLGSLEMCFVMWEPCLLKQQPQKSLDVHFVQTDQATLSRVPLAIGPMCCNEPITEYDCGEMIVPGSIKSADYKQCLRCICYGPASGGADTGARDGKMSGVQPSSLNTTQQIVCIPSNVDHVCQQYPLSDIQKEFLAIFTVPVTICIVTKMASGTWNVMIIRLILKIKFHRSERINSLSVLVQSLYMEMHEVCPVKDLQQSIHTLPRFYDSMNALELQFQKDAQAPTIGQICCTEAISGHHVLDKCSMIEAERVNLHAYNKYKSCSDYGQASGGAGFSPGGGDGGACGGSDVNYQRQQGQQQSDDDSSDDNTSQGIEFPKKIAMHKKLSRSPKRNRDEKWNIPPHDFRATRKKADETSRHGDPIDDISLVIGLLSKGTATVEDTSEFLLCLTFCLQDLQRNVDVASGTDCLNCSQIGSFLTHFAKCMTKASDNCSVCLVLFQLIKRHLDDCCLSCTVPEADCCHTLNICQRIHRQLAPQLELSKQEREDFLWEKLKEFLCRTMTDDISLGYDVESGRDSVAAAGSQTQPTKKGLAKTLSGRMRSGPPMAVIHEDSDPVNAAVGISETLTRLSFSDTTAPATDKQTSNVTSLASIPTGPTSLDNIHTRSLHTRGLTSLDRSLVHPSLTRALPSLDPAYAHPSIARGIPSLGITHSRPSLTRGLASMAILQPNKILLPNVYKMDDGIQVYGSQGAQSMPPDTSPRDFGDEQRMSLVDRREGTPGIGEVVYGNRNQLNAVARHWTDLKQRQERGERISLTGREEGVILIDHVNNFDIGTTRYQQDIQWQKLSYLGRGVSGKCHLAIDLTTEFKFCIKEMLLSNFEEDELEIWSMLSHPGIVKLYGAIRAGTYVYFIAELIDGGCLTEHINDQRQLGRRLGQRVALRYFYQLLQVLTYLQTMGIIHEDLKGDNILLRSDSTALVVADFGLARHVTSSTLVRASPTGSQTQWSPEKAASFGYDYRSDVWAITCVLCHIFNGESVWVRRFGHAAVLHFVIWNNSPPLDDMPKNVCAEISDIIMQGWITEREKRPYAHELIQHPAFHVLGEEPQEICYSNVSMMFDPQAEELKAIRDNLLQEQEGNLNIPVIVQTGEEQSPEDTIDLAEIIPPAEDEGVVNTRHINTGDSGVIMGEDTSTNVTLHVEKNFAAKEERNGEEKENDSQERCELEAVAEAVQHQQQQLLQQEQLQQQLLLLQQQQEQEQQQVASSTVNSNIPAGVNESDDSSMEIYRELLHNMPNLYELLGTSPSSSANSTPYQTVIMRNDQPSTGAHKIDITKFPLTAVSPPCQDFINPGNIQGCFGETAPTMPGVSITAHVSVISTTTTVSGLDVTVPVTNVSPPRSRFVVTSTTDVDDEPLLSDELFGDGSTKSSRSHPSGPASEILHQPSSMHTSTYLENSPQITKSHSAATIHTPGGGLPVHEAGRGGRKLHLHMPKPGVQNPTGVGAQIHSAKIRGETKQPTASHEPQTGPAGVELYWKHLGRNQGTRPSRRTAEHGYLDPFGKGARPKDSRGHRRVSSPTPPAYAHKHGSNIRRASSPNPSVNRVPITPQAKAHTAIPESDRIPKQETVTTTNLAVTPSLTVTSSSPATEKVSPQLSTSARLSPIQNTAISRPSPTASPSLSTHSSTSDTSRSRTSSQMDLLQEQEFKRLSQIITTEHGENYLEDWEAMENLDTPHDDAIPQTEAGLYESTFPLNQPPLEDNARRIIFEDEESNEITRVKISDQDHQWHKVIFDIAAVKIHSNKKYESFCVLFQDGTPVDLYSGVNASGLRVKVVVADESDDYPWWLKSFIYHYRDITFY